MERRLQGYFAAERDDVRAPTDLWANVSARLGEQDPAPWWSRMFAGSLQGMGRVYAGAAAAVAVAVVGAVAYAALIGFDGSDGPAYESTAASAPSLDAPAMAAAAPALPPTPAPAAVPEAAAPVAAAAMAAPEAMADAVPRAPAGSTMNASAAMAETTELPFRLEMWGLHNGVRTHLFWVDLPRGWQSSEPVLMDGVWSGVFSGPGVMLEYTFGKRMQTDMLLAAARTEASTAQKRMWDEYVIGNLAFIVAPPEGSAGDLLLTLQLPKGTLRLTGETLEPRHQEWALMIFRSIIA